MDTAELLIKSIGEQGRWQIFITIMIFLSKFAVAWHQLLMVVQHPVVPFTCSDETLDQCDENCPEHVFETDVFKSTVITEWDLVCDKKWVSSLIQTIVMFGILVGNMGFGFLADRFGRRDILIAAVVLQIITGVAAGCVPWLFAFILLRFLSNVATGGTMLTAFVILMEFTAKKYRTAFGILFQIPFHLGHAFLGPIAYFCRRWSCIQLAVSLPQIVLLTYFCILPESPRWLLTMKRTDDVVVLLEKVAKCNKLPTDAIRNDVIKFVEEAEKTPQRKPGNIVDLFRTPRMRTKTILMSLNWFITACLFYGVAELMGKLAGDIFLNTFIAGAVQVIGNISSIFMCNILGRKYSLIISFLITSIPLLIMMFLPEEPNWPIIAHGSVSMMGCAMLFSIIYVYAGELFPTVLRNIGMGVNSMFARCGSMLSPQVMFVKSYGEWIPNIVFGVLPLIGALVTFLFLPETNKTPLPDTIEEADKL